jgi:hypothetical protein
MEDHQVTWWPLGGHHLNEPVGLRMWRTDVNHGDLARITINFGGPNRMSDGE